MIVLSVLPSSSLWAGESQSITFAAIPDQLTTSGPVTLSASASSGLSVAFSIVSTPARATVTGDTLTLTGSAGSVTVKAVQAGNGAFDPAPPAFRTFITGDASQRFVRIAAGLEHVAGIRADGSLWTWGDNGGWQMADNTQNDRGSPVQVGAGSSWSRVACGEEHTVAIRSDGTLWGWGENYDGQLGDGTLTRRKAPVQIGTDTNWKEVSCGSYHTVALRTDGTMWSWGNNANLQLGARGAGASNLVPMQVGTDSNWAQISCGWLHNLALRTDGTLWTWGDNSWRQLGYGQMHLDYDTPTQIGQGRTWTQIAGGGYHSVALDVDGYLYSCGYNNEGQLGQNPMFPSPFGEVLGGGIWASVACGGYHTLAVNKDGTVWGWGNRGHGLKGIENVGVFGPVPLDEGEGGVLAIAAGGETSFIIRGDGRVSGWGHDEQGELGNGGVTLRPTLAAQFTELPSSSGAHALERRADGTLWAVGSNYDSPDYLGQIGNGNGLWQPVSVQVGTGFSWTAVAGGRYHSMAVRADGTLWSWGSNFPNVLGLPGNLKSAVQPTQIGSATTWQGVHTRRSHSMAVRSDGSLWSWGLGNGGKLGLGTSADVKEPAEVPGGNVWAVALCGENHTVALRLDGSLWAWGTTNGSNSPVQVSAGTTWTRLSCGLGHNAGIQTDGSLWMWGRNTLGQVGDGTSVTRPAPVQIGTATDWTAVSCGDNHTLALKADGSLWAWGLNSQGQLGTGDLVSYNTPQKIGTSHLWTDLPRTLPPVSSFVKCRDGSIWAFGGNAMRHLGLAPSGSFMTQAWPEPSSQAVESSFQAAVIAQGKPLPVLTSASGMPLTYTLLSGPAQVVNNQLTPTGLGTVEVLVHQPGDASWTAAPPTHVSFSIVSGQQLILFPIVEDRPVAPGNLTLGASATSGLPVSYRVVSGPATVSGSTLTLNGTAGTVVVEATQEGNMAWHMAEPVRMSFRLVMGEQLIVFPAVEDRPAGSGSFTLGASATSGLPVSYSIISGPATVSGNTLTLNGQPGRVVVEATQAGNEAWHPASAVEMSFEATALPVPIVAQSILFNPPASVALAESPLSLSATASSGLGVTLTLISGPPGTTLNGQTLTFNATGTVKIRATQTGNLNNLPAPVVDKTIQIKATPTAMTVLDLAQTYTSTPRPVRVINAPVTPVTVRYKSGTVWSTDAPTHAGSYPVEVTSGTLKKTATLVIRKAPLWVMPDDQEKFTGQDNPPLTYVYSGFQGEDTAVSSVTKLPIISTTARKTSAGGIYPIRSTGGASADYEILPGTASLTVATLAAQYEALLYKNSALAGKLEVTVAATSLSFSGRLFVLAESAPIPFRGGMEPDPGLGAGRTVGYGSARVDLPGGNRLVNRYDITIVMTMSGNLTASVSDGSIHSLDSRMGARVGVFTGKPVVSHQGSSTVLMASPFGAGPTKPAGFGHLAAVTDAKGVMKVAGSLADGTGVTASLLPDAAFTYRLYAQPYAGRSHSFLAATFVMQPHPDLPGRGHIPSSQIQSFALWSKAGRSTDKNYRDGIDRAQCSITLDPWLPPQLAKAGVPAILLRQRLGLDAQTHALTLDYALPESVTFPDLPGSTSLSATGVPSVPKPNPRAWKLTVNPANGLVSGSFNVLQGTKSFTVPFQGILRQPPSTEAAETALMGGASALVPQLSGQSGGSTTTQIIFGR